MAQLRDAQTSELILEGTPAEVVLAARELGPDEVLFDDVGEHFKPEAVLKAHTDELAGMAGAIRDTQAGSDDRSRLEERLADLKRAEARVKAELAPRAQRRAEKARARLG